MTAPIISFITYTKGTVQFVTSPQYETEFLNWLNTIDDSRNYKRETNSQVAAKCSPFAVHTIEKKEGKILSLIKSDEVNK